MKYLKFAGIFFFVALLTSCGGGDDSEKAEIDSTAVATDTSAKTEAVVSPPNTIITAPVNMLIIKHKVANYAKWQQAYDEHDSARLANGLHNYVIGRSIMDSNTIVVALKADDVSKAKTFAKDPGLKKAMQKGGVIGAPQISFTTATWQDTAVLPAAIRSLVTFAVKDADVWLKQFEAGKQLRLDNGVTDRVISHDVDDAKKILLVNALLDTAKAYAYFKSDTLKKRMAASGMIGAPNRFMFKIVKRY